VVIRIAVVMFALLLMGYRWRLMNSNERTNGSGRRSGAFRGLRAASRAEFGRTSADSSRQVRC
jgi:hypothetical protein